MARKYGNRLSTWTRISFHVPLTHENAAIVFGSTGVMAGLFGVPYKTFAPSTTLAGVIWAAIYFYLGVGLERLWHEAHRWVLDNPIHTGLLLVAVVALLAAAGIAIKRAWERDAAVLEERQSEA